MTSEQVQDLNDWMIHRGTPNIHEVIVQSFRRPHALEDDLHFIRDNKTCYIKAPCDDLFVFDDYIHQTPSAFRQSTHFGPFYYIQIDPQDYDEWRIEHLRKKYTSKHHPSLDLLPHQDPWQPQWHLNPTSPLPTSKGDQKGCKCLPHLQE